MPHDSEERTLEIDLSDPHSRRKFLALGGSVTAFALAGCQEGGDGDGTGDGDGDGSDGDGSDGDGSDGDGSDGSDGGDGGDGSDGGDGGDGTDDSTPASEVIDQTYVAAMGQTGTDIQFNLYGENRNVTVEDFIRDPIAFQHEVSGEWYPVLADDFWMEPEGDVYKIGARLKEGLKWHNGDDLTASDFVNSYRLEQYQWYPPGVYVMEVEVRDDREFEYTMNAATRTMDEHAGELFSEADRWGHPAYEEALQAFEDAGADWSQQYGSAESSDIEEVSAEALDFQIPVDEVDQVGYSVFKPVEFTDRNVRFEVFEPHPLSDRVNFTEVQLNHLPRDEAIGAALNSEQLTSNLGNWNEALVSSVPDSYSHYSTPGFADTSMRFNLSHPHVGKVAVRHALAHLIDNKRIAEIRGQHHIPKPTVFHGSASDRPQRMVGDFWDAHNSFSHDPGRATELLESAGYTKTDGQWRSSDGEPLSFQIIVAAGNSETVQALSMVTDMWSQEGINSGIQTLDSATFEDRYNRFDYAVAHAPQGVIRGSKVIDAVWLLYQGSSCPGLEGLTHEDIIEMSQEELVDACHREGSGWWEHPYEGSITEYAKPIASAEGSAWTRYAWKVPMPPEGFPKRDFFANNDFWNAGDDMLWMPYDLMKDAGAEVWNEVADNVGLPWDGNHRGVPDEERMEQILWMNWGHNHLISRYQLYENTQDLFIQQDGWANVPGSFDEFVENNWNWSDQFLAKHVLQASE